MISKQNIIIQKVPIFCNESTNNKARCCDKKGAKFRTFSLKEKGSLNYQQLIRSRLFKKEFNFGIQQLIIFVILQFLQFSQCLHNETHVICELFCIVANSNCLSLLCLVVKVYNYDVSLYKLTFCPENNQCAVHSLKPLFHMFEKVEITRHQKKR